MTATGACLWFMSLHVSWAWLGLAPGIWSALQTFVLGLAGGQGVFFLQLYQKVEGYNVSCAESLDTTVTSAHVPGTQASLLGDKDISVAEPSHRDTYWATSGATPGSRRRARSGGLGDRAIC